MKKIRRAIQRMAVSALVAISLVSALPRFARPAAAFTCNKWAATGGSDANDGTAERPWRSLGKLASQLPAGQTGCLKSGEVFDATGGTGIVKSTMGQAGAGVTIRSGPGGRASVRGWIHVQAAAHDLVLTDLNFIGGPTNTDGYPSAPKAVHLNIDGDRISLVGNDITDPYGICIEAGEINAYSQQYVGERADDVVIEGNRVHGCGMSPTLTFGATDSGVHGIYLVNTLRARVADNLLYDNRWRGLQTWPKAEGTLIANNLFDTNATHVNVGSALPDGYPWYSSNTTVRDNIMTNRVTDYRPEKNPAQVYGNFPNGSPSYGNQAFGNCLSGAGAPQFGGNGIAIGANITAEPQYVNRPAKDFRLVTGSPCTGKGPRSIQPATADLAVTQVANAQTVTVGSDVTYTATVTNRTDETLTEVKLTDTIPTGTVFASATPSVGACSGTGTIVCALGTLAARATATVRIVITPISQGSKTHTVTVSSAAADANTADNQSSRVTTVSGVSCTIVGTQGPDALVGGADNDVLCGLGGNDTVRGEGGSDTIWAGSGHDRMEGSSGHDVLVGGGGNDTALGGDGIDKVSYVDARSGVVVNLNLTPGYNGAWDDAELAGDAGIGYDTGFQSIEGVWGSPFPDRLVGNDLANWLHGIGGADRLYGYGGNDRLYGGPGDDIMAGGTGDDHLYGEAGNDTLDGEAGADTCFADAASGVSYAC